MSEETRFQTEMMRLMNIVIEKVSGLEVKVGGLNDKVGELEGKFEGLGNKVGGLEGAVLSLATEVAKNTQKLDILTAQFSDVTSMVIDHDKRFTKIEGDVAESQSDIH